MKLTDLLEMPVHRKKELPVDMGTFKPFFSEDSLARRYDFIAKTKVGTTPAFVVIRKNEESAAIGIPALRDDDQKPGMEVMCVVEFKPNVTLSGNLQLKEKGVLQVAKVRALPGIQTGGWGSTLYFSLAKAGYVIISDNLQYGSEKVDQ